jgi:hypothetical protein
MRVCLHLIHTASGVPVDVWGDALGTLDQTIAGLLAQGLRPPATDWLRTPEGEPLCPRHGAVMGKREKQGDCWHSHRVVGPDGVERFCRGYPHGGEKDGYAC